MAGTVDDLSSLAARMTQPPRHECRFRGVQLRGRPPGSPPARVGLSLVAKKGPSARPSDEPRSNQGGDYYQGRHFNHISTRICDARGKAVVSVKWGRDRRAAERDSRQLVLVR